MVTSAGVRRLKVLLLLHAAAAVAACSAGRLSLYLEGKGAQAIGHILLLLAPPLCQEPLVLLVQRLALCLHPVLHYLQHGLRPAEYGWVLAV